MMELSLSSERDEYDDFPPAKGGIKKNPLSDDEEDESFAPPPPSSKQPAKVTLTTSAKPNQSSSIHMPTSSATIHMPTSSDSSSSFTKPGTKQQGGWGNSSSSNTTSMPTTSTKPSTLGSETVTEEAIQAFNPADMEESISRKRSSSRSERRKRAEKKEKMQQHQAKKANEWAPGAIGDESDRSAHDQRDAGKKFKSSFEVDNGVVIGSNANQSMITDLARKGGKGAFAMAKELEYSSEEDEGDGTKSKRKKKDDEKKGGDEKKSGDGQNGGGSRSQADVAPLINDVAFDFVWRRWLNTIFDGLQFTWSAKSSDDSMPGVPGKFISIQLLFFLYPAITCLIFNALRYHDVITLDGVMALIPGVVGFLLHLLIHLIHRSILLRQRRPSSSTRVADSSGGDGNSAASSKKSSTFKSNHDNYEQDLQQQVKLQAIRNGSLKRLEPKEDKKKQKADAEDDDASLPPGQVKRPTQTDRDDDDEAQKMDLNAPVDLSLTSPSVCRFLIAPSASSMGRILLHAFLSGVYMAGACYFLEWTFIAGQYDHSTSLGDKGIIYIAFGWLSFSLSFYSLNLRPPQQEPAKYSADGWIESEINLPFYRLFYVALMIAFNLTLRLIAETGKYSIDQTILDIHDQCMYLYLFLPVFYAFGILPPLDALLFWMIEQINIIFFALTPTANTRRSIVFLLNHTLSAVIVFVVWLHSSHSAAMLIALGSSFLLAWNILPLAFGSNIPASKEVGNPDQPFTTFLSEGFTSSLLPLRVSTLLKFGIFAILWLIGIILAATEQDFIHSLQSLHNADIAFDIVAVLFMLVLYALSEIHQPYIIFHQLRNPFYERFVLKTEIESKKNSSGQVSKLKHQIFNWTIRAFLVVYVGFHQDPNQFVTGISTHSSATDKGKVTLFAYSVLLVRCFNQIFTDHFQALIHLLLVVLINLITEAISSSPSWTSLDWSVRFLIVGFVWQRFRYDFCPKVWTWLVLTQSSFTQPKLAMRHSSIMAMICTVLVPYHIGLIAFSSFLSTPILPFLGSPIFLLAFPRPQRIWQSYGGKYGMNDETVSANGNGGKDTVFYQQMFPSIYEAIQQKLYSGLLTYNLSAGDFFLLRHEPYLIWCVVLEKGLGYVVIQMKGLELQTTSCHTVEALRIDENVEKILDKSTNIPSTNPLGLSYGYQPMLSLNGIKSFSITKNVLTGIIDDHENLRLISHTFLKVVMYNLKVKLASSQNLSTLPASWLKPTVSNYDLQQLDERHIWSQKYYEHLFPKDAPTSLNQTDAALFKKICMSIYALVETLGSDVMASSGQRATPNHVVAVFGGKISSSLYSDYLLASNDEAKALKELVIDSYRFAVKALYDCAALASLEILSEESDEQFGEMETLFKEYQDEWYIGMVQNNPIWEQLVTQGEKKLFTIGKAQNEANKFTSLTLEMSTITLDLCTLSPTVIRSIWCSLTLELYYFANDDDERYSIQAHPQLLRNLTVQTSEPPFGYPVFSGLPTILSTE